LSKAKDTPAGFLALTLHAHLPYVVNHGTWPHGIEWLHEVAAETYLPLLRVLGNLERDGIPAILSSSLSSPATSRARSSLPARTRPTSFNPETFT